MEEALNEIRETADGFLLEHLDEFDPFEWKVEERSELRRKSFTELGMYLYCLEQYGDENSEVRSYVAERVADPRYRELLRRYPGRFTQNAFPAVALRATGGEVPRATERAVEDALRDPRLRTRERLPSELVDLLTQCRLWGYDRCDRTLESVLERSNLAYPPDVIAADTDDVYDLTHNVFLPTGWGTDHPALFEAPLAYDLEPVITGLLLRSMAAENADAVMELLVTGALQGQIRKSLVERAVRWLRTKMTTDAHVVGPVLFSTDELPDEWGQETRQWVKHYHANVQGRITADVLEGTLPVSEYHPEDASTSSTEFRETVSLGRALNQLHSYRLAEAAETLSGVGDETFRRFPAITKRIVTFLEDQRSGDSFGYWVDERRLYELETGSDDGFEKRLVEPVGERCEAVLADIPSVESQTASD